MKKADAAALRATIEKVYPEYVALGADQLVADALNDDQEGTVPAPVEAVLGQGARVSASDIMALYHGERELAAVADMCAVAGVDPAGLRAKDPSGAAREILDAGKDVSQATIDEKAAAAKAASAKP